MSLDITVFKDDGSSPAPEIVNPLSSADYVAKEAGKAFLAENSGMSTATLVVLPNLSYNPGDIIEVYDSKQGAVWYGKIFHVSNKASLTQNSATLNTILEITKLNV